MLCNAQKKKIQEFNSLVSERYHFLKPTEVKIEKEKVTQQEKDYEEFDTNIRIVSAVNERQHRRKID